MFVHYIGWNKKWNESVNIDEFGKRWNVRGTHAKIPYRRALQESWRLSDVIHLKGSKEELKTKEECFGIITTIHSDGFENWGEN